MHGLILDFVLVSSLAASRSACLEYYRQHLFELVMHAELVVAGSIDAVHERTFEFTVDRVLRGEAGASVSVERFEDWTCASRWAEYASGQRAVLFLRDHDGRGPWEVLGGGNEGELPRLDDGVVVPGFVVDGVETRDHRVDGATLSGAWISIDELAWAVTGFHTVMRWQIEDAHRPWRTRVGPRVEWSELERFAARSPLARTLVDEALVSPGWTGTRPLPDAWVSGSSRTLIGVELSIEGSPRLPGRRPNTETTRGLSGECVILGDVDGDGCDDVAIASPDDSFAGSRHGAVWIALLDASGAPRGTQEISARAGNFPATMNRDSRLGASLTPLGDVDGDGVPDLAVGASGWSGGGFERGGAWVLLLARDATVREAIELGAEPAMLATNTEGEFALGASLCALGDLDCDGATEVAIGGYQRGDERGPCGLRVASIGRDGRVVRATRFHAAHAAWNERSFGAGAICAVGDLDEDGLVELAIGDPHESDGAFLHGRGAVWIATATTTGLLHVRQRISARRGELRRFVRDGANFGRAVAATGDVDGDRVADLLVGSDQGLWLLMLSGDGGVKAHRWIDIEGGSAYERTAFARAFACSPQARGARVVASGVRESQLGVRDTLVRLFALSPDGDVAAW